MTQAEQPRRRTHVLFSFGEHGEDSMRALHPEDAELKTARIREQLRRTNANLLGVETLLPASEVPEQEAFFNSMSRAMLRSFQEPDSMSDIVKGLSEERNIRVLYPEGYTDDEMAFIRGTMQQSSAAYFNSIGLFRQGMFGEAMDLRLRAVDSYAQVETLRAGRVMDIIGRLHTSEVMAGEDIRAVYRMGSLHSGIYSRLRRIIRDAELSRDELKAKYPHIPDAELDSTTAALSRFRGVSVEREHDRKPYILPTFFKLVLARTLGRDLNTPTAHDAAARSLIETQIEPIYCPHVSLERAAPVLVDATRGMGVEDARRLSQMLAGGQTVRQFLDERGIELPTVDEVKASPTPPPVRRRNR